jgi:hypothetical protein
VVSLLFIKRSGSKNELFRFFSSKEAGSRKMGLSLLLRRCSASFSSEEAESEKTLSLLLMKRSEHPYAKEAVEE